MATILSSSELLTQEENNMNNLPINEQILALMNINTIFQFLLIHGTEILIGLLVTWAVYPFVDYKMDFKIRQFKIDFGLFTYTIIALIICETGILYFMG